MNTRLVVLIGLAAALTGGILYSTMSNNHTKTLISHKVIQTFARWKQQYGRLYGTPAEDSFRLSVFAEQLEFIERKNTEYEKAMKATNQKVTGPMLEMNMFGDLTNEEFDIMYNGASPIDSEYIQQPLEKEATVKDQLKTSKSSLGASWTPKVRHQGSCGSCWAFSSIVEIERQVSTDREYIDLSQQELVDCVTAANGCFGGHPEYAYNYMRLRGVHRHSYYPYIGAKSVCRNIIPNVDPYKVNTLRDTPFIGFSQARSQRAARDGVMPVVLVYSSGVFKYLNSRDEVYDAKVSGECNTRITHAITQITNKNGVVRVLNSWGTSWGARGFKDIIPCDGSNFWGPGGRLIIPYGY